MGVLVMMLTKPNYTCTCHSLGWILSAYGGLTILHEAKDAVSWLHSAPTTALAK